MTREEKKRKAAAIGAATMVAMMQNAPAEEFKESRWMLKGLTRAMHGRNIAHLRGRAFGTYKW